MKKIRFSGFAALAVAIALLLSAFTMRPSKADVDPLHWFDVTTSEYIDYVEPSELEAGRCDGDGVLCADGYSSITGTPGNEVPVFETYVMTIEKD